MEYYNENLLIKKENEKTIYHYNGVGDDNSQQPCPESLGIKR